MRGIAVLAAMGAAWLLAGGALKVRVAMPHVRLRTVVAGACCGLVAFLLALGLLGSAVPAAAFGLLAVGLPAHVAAGRERSRKAAEAAAWPDLLAHIRSSIAAGKTLPDAWVDAATRVGDPFTATIEEVRRELVYGAGFPAAMAVVRADADNATADRVTTTLVVANETGGHRVGEVLAALSASVAAESRLRAAHDAALTEQRWTAGVALVAPWVILGLSMATNPQAAAAFSTSEGAFVVGIGLVLTVAGYFLARRLAALSENPRMFR
ncbi:MAG: type II secretion system F family protein [Acidimicrobiia bacterium]